MDTCEMYSFINQMIKKLDIKLNHSFFPIFDGRCLNKAITYNFFKYNKEMDEFSVTGCDKNLQYTSILS